MMIAFDCIFVVFFFFFFLNNHFRRVYIIYVIYGTVHDKIS